MDSHISRRRSLRTLSETDPMTLKVVEENLDGEIQVGDGFDSEAAASKKGSFVSAGKVAREIGSHEKSL